MFLLIRIQPLQDLLSVTALNSIMFLLILEGGLATLTSSKL